MKRNELEKIKKEIEERKNLTSENAVTAGNKIFKVFLVAIVVILYFAIIILAHIFLNKNDYVLTCRFLNLFSLGIAIILFELAYTKDSGNIAIYGIEMLAVSIIVLPISQIIYELNITKQYILMAIIAVTLYYSLKAFVVYKNEERKHLKSLSDIDEIVKREPKRIKTSEEKKENRKEVAEKKDAGRKHARKGPRRMKTTKEEKEIEKKDTKINSIKEKKEKEPPKIVETKKEIKVEEPRIHNKKE